MVAFGTDDVLKDENLTFSDTVIYFPKGYIQELYANTSKIVVQAMKFKNDPFRWSPQKYPSSTDVLSLNIYTGNCTDFNKLTNNLTVKFDIKKPISEIHAMKGYVLPKNDMPRYEMLLEPNTILVFDMLSTTGDLKVRFKPGKKRPKGYTIAVDNILINATKARRRFLIKNKSSRILKLFLTIIPANEHGNKTINFTFTLQSRRCEYFDRYSERWNSFEEYHVGTINNSFINCSVTHLTNFKATILVLPNKLYFNRDMVLHLKTNYIVIIFLGCTFGVFCFFLLYASYLDKTSNRLIILTSIPNEKLAEQFPYIITVITGEFLSL